MLRGICIVIGFIAPAAALGQGAAQIWSRQLGSTVADLPEAVVADGAGGFLMAGTTGGSLGGVHQGSWDAFIMRGDADGNQTWITQFGTSGGDNVTDLVAPAAGRPLVVGYTDGALGAQGPFGAEDAFVAYYDDTGAPIWIRQFGTSSVDVAMGVGASGIITTAIVGFTEGDLAGPNAGGADAYVLRFNAAANQLVWARQFGTSDDDTAVAVAFFQGGVVVAGNTSGDLGAPNAGGTDVFLAAYDPGGTPLWTRQFGTSSNDFVADVVPDGVGGLVITGFTSGVLAGAAYGGTDIFVARCDLAGNPLWLRQLGTSGNDYGTRLHPSGPGTVSLLGTTQGSLWGAHAGDDDVVLARFDAVNNALLWGKQFGSPDDESATGLGVDATGRVYTCGATNGELAGPNAGNYDAFVARFGPCYPDCNGNGSMSVADFGCFQTKFVSGDPYADCNADGQMTVADFGCFQTEFVSGCP